MSPPFPSPSPLVALHAVRITGRLRTEMFPHLTGLTMDVVEVELGTAVAAGWVRHHDGVVPGWSLTPEGRAVHLELLADERRMARRDTEIAAAYDDLMALNDWFKALCTEWQMNDHPTDCIIRLRATHPRVEQICRRLAGAMTRFVPYEPRFSRALERLGTGDLDAFTTPLADSYHDVWMHLHEDLLLTLGRERGSADGS